MLDIRKEMESSVGDGIGDEAIYPEDAIDEDETNEEFKLLELECENEECSAKVKDEVGEKQSDDVSAKILMYNLLRSNNTKTPMRPKLKQWQHSVPEYECC